MMISRYPFEFTLHLMSLGLACTAALFAIYLIPVAGKAKAWLAFAGACLVLAINRVLETLSYSGILKFTYYYVVHDVLDVVMAGCLLFGIYFIRDIFSERRVSRRQLEKQLDELQRFQRVSVDRELSMKALYEENQALKTQREQTHG